MSNKDIKIIRDNQGGRKVDPPKVNQFPNQDITWEAPNNCDIILWFPNSKVFGVHELYIPKGDSQVLKVMKNAKPDEYPYACFCINENCFAEGESNPIIIVD